MKCGPSQKVTVHVNHPNPVQIQKNARNEGQIQKGDIETGLSVSVGMRDLTSRRKKNLLD